MRSVFYFLMLFVSIPLMALHPVHFAVFNFEISSEYNAAYSIKVNNADFHSMATAYYGSHFKLDPGKQEIVEEERAMIEQLVNSNFVVQSQEKIYKSILDSVFINRQELFLYFTLNFTGKENELIITNRLFMEAFSDQKNLLIFVYKGKESGFIFDKKNTKHQIKFNKE